MNKPNFRIYVACLASYNDGIMHGCWIEDLQDKSEEEVFDEINAMLKESKQPGAEEWAIHDHEGFDGMEVSEYHDICELVECAQAVYTSEYDADLIAGVSSHLDCGAAAAISYLEDNYLGLHDNLESYAVSFLEETGGLESLPSYLQGYFDYQAYGRDLELNGDVFTVDAHPGIHVIQGA